MKAQQKFNICTSFKTKADFPAKQSCSIAPTFKTVIENMEEKRQDHNLLTRKSQERKAVWMVVLSLSPQCM